MATKKKELLEQENTAPETTVTVENAPPPDEAQADMAAPADGGDLNELLASMDQPDEEAPTIEDDGSLPELTESEMFGEMDTDATVADALPGDDDAALTEGSDSDDGEGASAVPADDGAADVPSEPVSGAAEEPEPPKPKRATRRKKTAPAESTEPAEGVPAEAEPPAPMAPTGEDAPSDDGEAAAAEVPASLAEPLAEAAPAPTSTPRRTAAPRRSEPSILTIRSREDVETQEDREDIIWHEIHNAYRTRRILTGKLGGIEQLDNRKTVAVVDYKGFRIIIPLKEMMINLGRSPSGQEYTDLMLRQNKILGNMLGADIDFVVRGIDSKTRSVVASRREAMMRKRQTFYFDLDPDGMYRVYEGRIVQARVIAVAEKVVRVEVFGVECSILARDLAWDWIGDAHERFAVGDEVLVRITTPKTASGTRTIPILYPQVAEQLRTLIEVMDTLYPEDLVMNGYHGFLFRNREGYFLSAHNINRAIQRISIAYNAEEMDQAELEDREPELLPHFSVHNMRHTFCTRLCESTNDIKFIQQVMGHADFSTTMDIYTHITQENMREKAEAIKGNLVLM